MRAHKAWTAAVIVLGLIAGAVTAYQLTKRPGEPAVSGPVAVSPARTTRLDLGGGGSVTVPANAVTGDGTLSARSVSAPAPAPAGLVLIGSVYDIEISGTRLAASGTATLRLPAPIPAPDTGGSGPNAALLAYYDAAAHAWTPVDARFDAATHTVVASVPHLSLWSVISVDTKALSKWAVSALKTFLGVNDTAAQPSCPGAALAKLVGIKVASSSGGLVKWCAGEDGGQAVLRVANDRGFSMEVDYPAAWSVRRDGWPGLDAAVIDRASQLLTAVPGGQKTVVVPGGQAVTFTVPLGRPGTATARPSAVASLVSAFIYGIDTLVRTTEQVPFADKPDESSQIKAIQTAFASKDCLSSADSLASRAVASAAEAAGLFWDDLHLATGCLGDAWKTAYGAAGFIVSFIVGVFVWLVDGLKLIGQDLGAIVETAVYWRGYTMSLTVPVAILTLGTGWAPDQVGYGQVAPPLVFNGGDPTGLVKDIAWQSWGGAQAIGTGTAEHVGPNQIVADGTLAQATIVAFEPGICNGSPAYQAIEWYFPEYGEHFDPGNYINMCTGEYVGPNM